MHERSDTFQLELVEVVAQIEAAATADSDAHHPEWRIDDATRRLGRHGIAATRAEMLRARRSTSASVDRVATAA